jgi:adenylate kinase family enzyme
MTCIIIEGPDGAGKSSVASAISQCFGIPIIEYFRFETREKWEQLEEFKAEVEYRLIKQFAEKTDVNFIVCRLWIGDRVYARAFNRDLPEYARPVKNSIVVYLTADVDELIRRKSDEVLSADEVALVKKLYDEEISASSVDIFYFDTTLLTKQQMCDAVVSVLKEREIL